MSGIEPSESKGKTFLAVEKFPKKRRLNASPCSDGEFFENSDEWLTTDEAAAYLKVSPGFLRNLCCSGLVPYYKLNRLNRYPHAGFCGEEPSGPLPDGFS